MTPLSLPPREPSPGVALPERGWPRSDHDEPEDRAASPRRREGLWVIADMPEGQFLVLGSPQPGLVQ